MQLNLLSDGHCSGPLFAPIVKRRAPRDRSNGWDKFALRCLNAAVPWTDWAACRARWGESKRLTLETGVQHSVDHIVPLVHPLVCGLHAETNLRVIPLAENIRKSNNAWPDMWVEQFNLF